MTYAQFPTLAGLGWSVTQTPMWSTNVQKAVSGREFRIANWSWPRWKWSVSYEFLRQGQGQNELFTLRDFYNAQQGSYNVFQYTDPNFNTATAQQFAIGDGVTTQFPIIAYGGAPAYLPSGTINSFWNGVAQNPSSYNLAAPNYPIAIYSTPPGAGVVLTWTGNYAYLCRFVDDQYDFENFMQGLWTLKKLEFITLK